MRNSSRSKSPLKGEFTLFRVVYPSPLGLRTPLQNMSSRRGRGIGMLCMVLARPNMLGSMKKGVRSLCTRRVRNRSGILWSLVGPPGLEPGTVRL
jgi:hypothetical protein